MPIHDWTRVDPGIFHAFRHGWISEIGSVLNSRALTTDYYSLPEQQVAGLGPDIFVEFRSPEVETQEPKRSSIVVRHVSGDRIIAVLEIISPGDKASRNAFKDLIDKACELLEHKIHLLIVDLFPPTKRDPQGVHGALWEEIADETFTLPPDKPLTMAAYESWGTVKAFVEPITVGDSLPDMPLFLEPGAYVAVPLETTYCEAFASVPARWQRAL